MITSKDAKIKLRIYLLVKDNIMQALITLLNVIINENAPTYQIILKTGNV